MTRGPNDTGAQRDRGPKRRGPNDTFSYYYRSVGARFLIIIEKWGGPMTRGPSDTISYYYRKVWGPNDAGAQ